MTNLNEYLEAAKVAELAEQLRAGGYEVALDSRVDDVVLDLVARKDRHVIAYEVKATDTLRGTEHQLQCIREIVRRHGYEFRLVLVTPPHRVDVEIADFEQSLADYITNDMPSELNQISRHTVIEGIVDAEFDRVVIGHDTIEVAGSASIEVELQYDDEGDVDFSTTFPLTFTATMDHDLSITVATVRVDTEKFFR